MSVLRFFSDEQREYHLYQSRLDRLRVERTLEAVWQNPLGFTVTRYRIDAETLDASTGRG